MINVGINIASLLGLVLLILGLLLIPLRVLLKRPFQIGNLIQDIVLTLVYVLCGVILFFQGWRLDPALQFCQLLLIVSIIFWVMKDLNYRR